MNVLRALSRRLDTLRLRPVDATPVAPIGERPQAPAPVVVGWVVRRGSAQQVRSALRADSFEPARRLPLDLQGGVGRLMADLSDQAPTPTPAPVMGSFTASLDDLGLLLEEAEPNFEIVDMGFAHHHLPAEVDIDLDWSV